MKLTYETTHLYLRILDNTYAPSVLNFYLNDMELFEQYEPEHSEQFYTKAYQKTSLSFEYQLFIRMAGIRFWLFEKSQPEKIIGTISFLNIQRNAFQSCHLGYKLASSYHHRGYATQALEKGIEIIFSELGLHRIETYILPHNTPSKNIMNRLNFTFEGICHDFAYLKGSWNDHERYSLCNPNQT